MNVLDCYVTKILGEPYERYDKWWLDVEADCEGQLTRSTLMFASKELAEQAEVGLHYLA